MGRKKSGRFVCEIKLHGLSDRVKGLLRALTIGRPPRVVEGIP